MVFAAAGDLSYPVYALHWPIMALALGPLSSTGLLPNRVAAVLATGTCAVAWLAAFAYDAPVRARLSRWTMLRRSQVEKAPAF